MRRGKDQEEKIEPNIVCKIAKRKMREYVQRLNNEIIKSILKDNRSTRKIKKELSIGKNWINYKYIIDENGEKTTNRRAINRVATSFHAKFAGDESKERGQMDRYRQDKGSRGEQKPEFTIGEVEHIIKNLKVRKAAGHDKIINEQLKLGGHQLAIRIKEMLSLIHI